MVTILWLFLFYHYHDSDRMNMCIVYINDVGIKNVVSLELKPAGAQSWNWNQNIHQPLSYHPS